MACQHINTANFIYWQAFDYGQKSFWPIKYEISGFIWVIKKVKHLVKSFKISFIIETDYKTFLNIMQ